MKSLSGVRLLATPWTAAYAQDGRRWQPPKGDTRSPSDSSGGQRDCHSQWVSVPGSLEEQTQNGEGQRLCPGPGASPRQGTGKGPLTPRGHLELKDSDSSKRWRERAKPLQTIHELLIPLRV